MTNHQTSISLEEYDTFVCGYCDAKSKTEKGIKYHIYRRHNVPYREARQTEVMHIRLYL